MQRLASLPHSRRRIRALPAVIGLTAALGAIGLSASAAAQTIPPVIDYPSTYTDLQNIPGITGITDSGCSDSDDCLSAAINLPFPFTFIDQTTPVSSVRVDSNGYVTLGTTSQTFSDRTNDSIPNSATPNNYIGFAWDDLRSGQVRYGVVGTSPNRIFIMEWEYRWWLTFTGANAKSQVWLFEADNHFEVHYANGANLANNITATIGFENSNGTQGLALDCSPSCSRANIISLDNRVIRVGAIPDAELRASFGTFPRGGFPGTTGSGTLTIENLGDATATDVDTEVWLSLDDTFDPTVDFLIGTAVTASVPSGTTDQAVNFTVPSGIPPGDYRVIAFVDSTSEFTELAESDNVVFSDQRFGTAFDLSATDCLITNAGGIEAGQRVNFDVSAVNALLPFTGGLQVRVRASVDSNFDTSDPILGIGSVNLTGAQGETVSGSFVLPAGIIPPGRYFAACEVDVDNGVTEAFENNNSVVGSATFGAGPELRIGSITVPPVFVPGSTQPVTTVIDSVGVPFNATIQYRLYASLDDTLDTAVDIDLGLYEASFEGQNQVADVENIAFPLSLVPVGRYSIIAVLDPSNQHPEQFETNNVTVSGATFVNGIDFFASAVNVVGLSGTDIQARDTLRVQGTVEAIGLPFTGNVAFGVYFSTDMMLDETDITGTEGLLFFPDVTAQSFDVTFTVPSSLLGGTYNLLVVANPTDAPVEAFRPNNTIAFGSQLTMRAADLRAASLTTPGIAFIGRSLETTLVLRNDSSNAEARGFQYRYFLSENDLIRVTDLEIFTSETATLAPNSEQVFTDQLPIPSTFTSTQALYLGVVIDIFSAVPETNENNNIARTLVPLPIVFPIPDLSVQLVSVDTAGAVGEQIAITRLIANGGVADAGSFSYTYYLSNNPTITPQDVEIGTFQLALPVGTDDYAIDTVSVPSGLAPGTYFVGVIADPGDAIVEIDETNNTAVGPSIPIFDSAIRILTDILPGGTLGIAYETGLSAVGGPLPIVWSVAQGNLPNGLELDATDGILAGTPTAEGVFDFTIRASSGTAFTERTYSVRITSPTLPLAVSTTSLPSAISGRDYQVDLAALGGVPPYRWEAVGVLPAGISVSETGRLEGTPETPGQFPLTFLVTDDIMSTASAQLALNVLSPSQSLQIEPLPLPTAVVGLDYCTDDNRFTLSATRGIPPYAWGAVSGLPPGMTLNEMGELCGTPEMAGTFDLSVVVRDSSGVSDTALFRLTVRESDACAITTFLLPNVLVNQPYTDENGATVKLNQVSCAEPVTWTIVPDSGGLPPGLTLASDGVISGTPNTAGTYAFSAQVVDGSQSQSLQPLSILVEAPEPPPPAEDDCTCATVPDRQPPVVWLALVLPAAVLMRRRRRGPSTVSAALAALLVMSGTSSAYAQQVIPGTGYVFSMVSEPYQGCPGSLTNLTTGDGAGVKEAYDVNLPFPFTFYRSPQSTITIFSGGTLGFPGGQNITITNTALGDAATPNGLISVFWGDLELLTNNNGFLGYSTTGAAPNRQFCIEWNNFNDEQVNDSRLNFKVVLYEGGAGQFDIHYAPVTGPNGSYTATMGMEDPAGGRAFDFRSPACSPNCDHPDIVAMADTKLTLIGDSLDVIASNVTTPQFAAAGSPQPIGVTITSIDDDPLGPFDVQVAIADNPEMTGAVVVGGDRVSLTPFEELSTVITATISSAFSAGTRIYWELAVDTANELMEVAEDNNRFVSMTSTRLLPATADLAVVQVVSATTAEAGASVAMEAQVSNLGGLPVSGGMVSAVLSTNPFVSGNDPRFDTQTVSLAPLTSTVVSFTFTVPNEIQSGQYTAGVMADPDNVIPESDEINNGRAAPELITVSASSIALLTQRLPQAIEGEIYRANLRATGGSGQYIFERVSGRFPNGVGLISETGEFFGRALELGTFSLTIRVTDAENSSLTDETTLDLTVVTVREPLTVVTRDLPGVLEGTPFDVQLRATGGVGDVALTWSATGLPMGVDLNGDGILSGAIEMVGSYAFDVAVTDGTEMASRSLSLEVQEGGGLRIVPRVAPEATIAQPYSFTLESVGGQQPVTWQISQGSPRDFGIDVGLDGVVSGTPTQVGTVRFVVLARDAGPLGAALTDEQAITIDVKSDGALRITTESLPSGTVGRAYDRSIAGAGGLGPYRWRIVEGQLPAGLTEVEVASTNELLIDGEPQSPVSTNFLVEVTDLEGRTASRPFRIDIEEAPVILDEPEDGCRAAGRSSGLELLLLAFVGAVGFVRRRRRA